MRDEPRRYAPAAARRPPQTTNHELAVVREDIRVNKRRLAPPPRVSPTLKRRMPKLTTQARRHASTRAATSRRLRCIICSYARRRRASGSLAARKLGAVPETRRSEASGCPPRFRSRRLRRRPERRRHLEAAQEGVASPPPATPDHRGDRRVDDVRRAASRSRPAAREERSRARGVARVGSGCPVACARVGGGAQRRSSERRTSSSHLAYKSARKSRCAAVSDGVMCMHISAL